LARARNGSTRHLRADVPVLGAKARGAIGADVLSGAQIAAWARPTALPIRLAVVEAREDHDVRASIECFRALATCFLALAVVAVGPAWAQSKSEKPKHEATALPQPLTHESIRELVSRLDDADVRKLLIAQLDRSAAPATGKGGQAMSGMVEANAGMVRARLAELRDAFRALPATFKEVVARLDEPEGPSVLALIALLVAAMFVVAWVASGCTTTRCATTGDASSPMPDETFSARAFRRGAALLLDLVGILVFALAALAFFLALWQGHGLRRIAIIELLVGVVVVRTVWLFARFLLAKRTHAEGRLLPFADAPGSTPAPLRRGARRRVGSVERRQLGVRARRRKCGDDRPSGDALLARRPRNRAVDGVSGAGADRGADPRQRHAQRGGRLAR
jgi:hypothetical protein